jgi:menaquinone-dependent protoporphyrinogen IX oxidase
MNNKVLIAYSTNSGSTSEVAEKMAMTLKVRGHAVDVLGFDQVTSLEPYNAVIVGAPMIFGWHTPARKFLKRYQSALSRLPVAIFGMAMALTNTPELHTGHINLELDPALARPPQKPGSLSLRERFTLGSTYLKGMLRPAPAIQPVSVGFFKGKLDLGKLKPLQLIFALLIINAQPGDFRNWELIGDWSDKISPLLMKIEK